MIRRVAALPCAILLALAAPAAALTLEFAEPALETAARVEPLTSYLLPIGPFRGDAVESLRVEGALDQRAWRLDGSRGSTLQVLQPLRGQVLAAGFRLVFECDAMTCGGFDFRYGTEVLPEPDMHVDLVDFRYLAAERTTPEGPEHLSLIVSRTVDKGFVQLTRVGPSAALASAQAPAKVPDPASPALPAATPAPNAGGGQVPAASGGAMPLAARLTTGGAQVLPDLVFASGSSALADGSYASLAVKGGAKVGHRGGAKVGQMHRAHGTAWRA